MKMLFFRTKVSHRKRIKVGKPTQTAKSIYSPMLYSKQTFYNSSKNETQSTSTANFFKTENQSNNLLADIMRLSYPKIGRKTYLLGVQHFLPTSFNLFYYLIMMGFDPKNMLFSGKPYSTEPSSLEAIKKLGVQVRPEQKDLFISEYLSSTNEKIKAMWEKCDQDLKTRDIDSIIILDEGGRCIEQIPRHLINQYPIVGIEQTRGGLYSKELSFRPFPVIEVASSAAKKYVESPIIADTIIRKLNSLITFSNAQQFGVVGNGAVGTAIINHLISKGCKVFVYDINISNALINQPELVSKNIIPLPSAEHVVRNSDCIFGCTGKDITENFNVFELIGDKIFISCSSEDKEFNSALKAVKKRISGIVINPLQDITLITESNDKILLASGGFPINFDRTPESDPNEMILMRGLLMGASIQAAMLLKMKSNSLVINGLNRIMLDPTIQNYVVKQWLHYFPNPNTENNFIKNIGNINWIKENSNGSYWDNPLIAKAFSINKITHNDSKTLVSVDFNSNTSLPKLTH